MPEHVDAQPLKCLDGPDTPGSKSRAAGCSQIALGPGGWPVYDRVAALFTRRIDGFCHQDQG
jgi:hypothetical protein